MTYHAEINALRQIENFTRRATAPALEEILYEILPVLDHGFIRVVDYMGDDGAVVQAARVSYGQGTKKVHEDQGLINYLMRHHHTTPFEMCEIKLHVKVPIFVARQWLRHRTANVNEYSARYSILDREFYLPQADQFRTQAKNNRQGRGESLEEGEAATILGLLKEDALRAYEHYQQFLNEESEAGGLARELARINLPISFYTQFYWKIDLHNWMHFIQLRADRHAQHEIRVYAEKMLEILERWLPLTYQSFKEYRLYGVQLSAKGLQALKQLLSGQVVDPVTLQMSAGEWRELKELFGL